MFTNLQPIVTFRQGYSFSTCSGRTRYPCSYFIFAIKNIIDPMQKWLPLYYSFVDI